VKKNFKINDVKISKDEIKKAIVERIVDSYIKQKRFSLLAFNSKVDSAVKKEVLKEIEKSRKIKKKIKELLNDDEFIRKSVQKAVVDYVMENLRWEWEE